MGIGPRTQLTVVCSRRVGAGRPTESGLSGRSSSIRVARPAIGENSSRDRFPTAVAHCCCSQQGPRTAMTESLLSPGSNRISMAGGARSLTVLSTSSRASTLPNASTSPDSSSRSIDRRGSRARAASWLARDVTLRYIRRRSAYRRRISRNTNGDGLSTELPGGNAADPFSVGRSDETRSASRGRRRRPGSGPRRGCRCGRDGRSRAGDPRRRARGMAHAPAAAALAGIVR
jgi:hypothetical protein